MSYIEKNDIELLRLFKDGDIYAFETIYAKYWHTLYQSSFFMLKDKDASKDIVQELFTWLWINKSVVDIDNLKAYLSASVKFKVANYIRANKVRYKFQEYVVANPNNQTQSLEEELEFQELNKMVKQAVAQLPPKCREIYYLSRDKGYSNKEISMHLNLSIKTVENQLTIALRKIKTSLQSLFILLIIFCNLFF